MAIKLKQAGLDDFIILEKADDLGGTWRENTYPGAECDVPSALYSYSFEHNSAWEYKWSGQAQILKYQHDTAARYDLGEKIAFNQTVKALVFDEEHKHWQITTVEGTQYQAQHVVSAIGQLHFPSTPVINGAEEYQGSRFHSAQWDHSIDLTGKRVAVIGNAASAVQFVPEIVEQVAELTVFQRSPNWMIPKIDRPYSRWEQRLSEKLPFLTNIYRWFIWVSGEYMLLPAIRGNRLARWIVKDKSLRLLKKHIKDPALMAKLTPDYPVGAKRVLFSDHYYAALGRKNVHLETSGIESFTNTGIKRKDGVETQFDVVIYATGFKTNPFFAHIDIQGLGGLSIRDAWSDGAQAYLGVATHGFPNLHMLYGPNTNLGHTSIIIMLEAQAKHVVRAIRYLDQHDGAALDIKAEVEQDYNQQLQQRLNTMAFSAVEQSWYKDGNKVTNNWVGGTREYASRLRHIAWSAYSMIK